MPDISQKLLGMPRFGKGVIVGAIDATLCVLTVMAAFYLRLDQWETGWPAAVAAIGAIVIALPVFRAFGLYRAVHRFGGAHALQAIAQAVFVFGMIYILLFAIMGIPGIPRTVGLIQPLLLFVGVGASRAIATYWFGGRYRRRRATDRVPVLIYGAGMAGQQLALALRQTNTMVVAGFVDDNPSLQNAVINNIRVHRPTDLTDVSESLEIQDIFLALPSVSRRRRNEIIKSLYGLDVRVRTLPGLSDLASGRVQVSDLRPLDIEDLLGRDVVTPNVLLLQKNVTDRVVMVTGAGGSIGSELCRQILALRPSTLVLVENSEFALYSIHQELEARAQTGDGIDCDIVPLLASVRDAPRIRAIIANWHPYTIYHAAAYKHVPLVEHNPAEGIINNTFGTLITAQAALDVGVPNFVLISTDKAVRPTNVMGTTKRLAEIVLQSLSASSKGTCFSMVRFGNVLGSSGSVVPLFARQIAEGGPITITHKDITRYFMTIPEAAQLVIQAGAMARGGEVFVLDMGEPVRIVELARNMIELSGLTVKDDDNPDGEIEIAYVGLRPGEKLYEELLIGANAERTSHPRIMKANENFIIWSLLKAELDGLVASLEVGNVIETLQILARLVPEYSPEANTVDLVHLRAGVELKAAS
jgi:FlaA1/EpsC-like NDP-sugar epimerase